MNTTKQWFQQVTGASVNAAAGMLGLSQSTLNRQLNDGRLSPENVVKIARAYDASPLDGLVAIGLIDPSEAEQMSVDEALRKASDQQLAAAVLARVAEASDEDGWLTRPLDAGATQALATVHTLHPEPDVSQADVTLAARDDDDDAEAQAQTEEP